MEIILAKAPGGYLIPVDQQSMEAVEKLKLGQGVKVNMTRYNNVKFHRKLFALANLAYESWTPSQKEHKGVPIEKNFDQFREDITILAGFYETRIRVNGETRFIAKSWSFSSMSDEEKDKLYNGIINVVLKYVLTNYTRDDLDNVINRLLQFT